jgi:hypothetical protein
MFSHRLTYHREELIHTHPLGVGISVVIPPHGRANKILRMKLYPGEPSKR